MYPIIESHRVSRITQPKNNYFVQGNEIFSYLRCNTSWLHSSLLAFVRYFILTWAILSWPSHHNPRWGMLGMCLTCDRERLVSDEMDQMLMSRWDLTTVAEWQSAPLLPICYNWLLGSWLSLAQVQRHGWEEEKLDNISFHFPWTLDLFYSMWGDDTIYLLKRVDSNQTQRQRGQNSWIALKS